MIVSLHVHKNYKCFGAVPAIAIKDLFFDFIHYEFNKSNVLLVINECSFEYLDSLSLRCIESLELLDKLLLRLKIGDTPHSYLVFLDVLF